MLEVYLAPTLHGGWFQSYLEHVSELSYSMTNMCQVDSGLVMGVMSLVYGTSDLDAMTTKTTMKVVGSGAIESARIMIQGSREMF
jgi:hypothetical protein